MDSYKTKDVMADVNFQKVSRQLRKVVSPKDGTFKFLGSSDPEDVSMLDSDPGNSNLAARMNHVHRLKGGQEQIEEQESMAIDLQKIYMLMSEAMEIEIPDIDAIQEIGETDPSFSRLTLKKITMLTERMCE